MTDDSAAVDLLTDSFGRIRGLVETVTDGLTPEVSTFRVDDDANTVGWLLWHLARVQDDHVAELAGTEQVWPQWRQRFALPFDDLATGYGQSSTDVAAVRVDATLLSGYHADVDAFTTRYLTGLNQQELGRVVDTHWDPPVTAAARLVSVVGDCLQHLGQAAYVRGVAERRGSQG